jgi:phosphatidylglycerophosphatase A
MLMLFSQGGFPEETSIMSETLSSQMLRNSATVFGLGRIRPAPGTWGTLATIPLALLLNLGGILFYMLATVLLTTLAIVAAQLYENHHGGHDHSEVVIDEVVGFLVTMTWLPMTWQAYLCGFFLFRILDIFKPFPIGYLDKNVKGGVGVVVDDLVAGLIANVALQFLYTHTSWLGNQILVS